jgi:hypothetical protein
MFMPYPREFVGLFDAYVEAFPDAPSIMVIDDRLGRVYWGASPMLEQGTTPGESKQNLEAYDYTHGIIVEMSHRHTKDLLKPLKDLGPPGQPGVQTRLFYFVFGRDFDGDLHDLQLSVLRAASDDGLAVADGIDLYALRGGVSTHSRTGTITVERFREYLAEVDERRKFGNLSPPMSAAGYGADEFVIAVIGRLDGFPEGGLDMEMLPGSREMEFGLRHDAYGFEGYVSTSSKDIRAVFGDRQVTP